MQAFRRRLQHLAGGWLVAQLSVLTVTPASLCAGMPNTVAALECTCSHGDGQVCPMHHTRSTSRTKSCSCRGTTDSAATLIASLFGPSAVLAVPIVAPEPAVGSPRSACLESRPLDSCLVPDSPPPRAWFRARRHV